MRRRKHKVVTSRHRRGAEAMLIQEELLDYVGVLVRVSRCRARQYDAHRQRQD